MCEINLVLRIVTTLIFSVVIYFLDNYYLFWLLFFYMLVLFIIDRKCKPLFINFIVILILLFNYFTYDVKILLKVLYIVNLMFLFFFSFKNKEKKYLYCRYNKKKRKKIFYKNNLQKVINNNKDKSVSIYGNDVLLNNKVNRDMKQLYLCSKIRFYNYSDRITNFASCGLRIYDFVFMIFVLIIFILLFMYW